MVKKILLVCALLLGLAGVSHGQCSTTPNIPLQTVNQGATSGWTTCVNGNFTILDSLLGGVSSLTLNSTTPSVQNGRTFKASNSSDTAITNFTNGFQGQTVVMICNDAHTSLTSGSNLSVNGPFKCTGSLSGSIVLTLQGSVWTEMARSTYSLQLRLCDIAIGDTSGGAVTDAQLGPQKRICQIPATATLLQITVSSDAGSPSVIVGRSRCTTFTTGTCSAETRVNVLSSALASASGFDACSNVGGTTGIDGGTTCSATLQNTGLLTGDYLELVSGTAGGTAKWVTVHILYQVNN